MGKKYLNCLFCKEFYFMAGIPACSEMTPGSDLSIGCDKRHWELRNKFDSEETYRRKMLTATTCKDFAEREESND